MNLSEDAINEFFDRMESIDGSLDSLMVTMGNIDYTLREIAVILGNIRDTSGKGDTANAS